MPGQTEVIGVTEGRPKEVDSQRQMKIPATKYYFPSDSIEFILEKAREIFDSGAFLAMGKYCEQFEKEFAKYNGSRFAVTTNSGTGALEIVLRAIGVEGGEVVLPSNTFAATCFAVIRAGGKPVFADSGADLTLDPIDVKKKISARTKAVITVHIGGLVSPSTPELREVCDSRGIRFVEDAAHAQGSTLSGKKAGTFGVAGAFSFFSTKVMTTGEGGMVVTDDPSVYSMALELRDQGKVRGKNYHNVIGYNWRMTEFQALMGIAQLQHLEEFIRDRERVAQIYDSEFAGVPSVKTLVIPEQCRSNFYKYVIFLPSGADRELVQSRLKTEFGVSMGGTVYDTPLHQQPVFLQYGSENPQSEKLAKTHACPPIYVNMREDEVQHVVKSIARCLA